MRKAWGASIGLLACALVAAACGRAGVQSSHATGPVTVVMAEAPNSLDPAVGDTPQALEPDWLVYTPLLTYEHASGVLGTIVVPGLASQLPVITDGGRTYALSLQPGLVYSDGQPVRASDFTWAVERAIRLRWPGAARWVTRRIAGAAAFAAGRAKTISGITADDATGQITIRLTAPFGAFEDVLALPALAPVPSGTPFRDLRAQPPPGVGPYVFGRVVPGGSFSLLLNPRWHRGILPAVRVGHVDVTARVTGDATGDALAVLDNRADVFDPADRIPSAVLPQIVRGAGVRYSRQALNTTYLIFMNVTRTPFSNQLARIAVQTALDDNTLKAMAPDLLQEGCYLLPPSMWGHPHDQCPRGNIEKGGDISAAKALVSQSGMAGTAVTVWSQAGAPASNWMAYYASLLNQIGFRAHLQLVPDASYYTTIGDLSLHPQTGFAELSASLPTPLDFYGPLTSTSLPARGNLNWGQIDDAYIDRQVRQLSGFPTETLDDLAEYWHELERYVADRAYVAVFGYATAPQFVSDRIAYSRVVLNPVMGLDWSSLRLK